MSITLVKATIKPDKASEMEKAGREMFTAIEAAQPQGVRYASCKLADGETYMILLELNDNENNPLGTVQAFRDLAHPRVSPGGAAKAKRVPRGIRQQGPEKAPASRGQRQAR